MAQSKLTRRALALRLFAAAVAINILLLLFFLPNEATPSVQAQKFDGIEIKVRGQLFTAFSAGKKVLLLRPHGPTIGSAQLVRLEEDGIVLALSEELYRKHHRSLIHEEWAFVPYIDGMETRPRTSGVSYEIAY